MGTLAIGRSGVALVLASWCWLVAASARAQWVPNGVPLCTAEGVQTRPRIVSDGLGGVIVAWSDSRDYDADSYGNNDVYAQRVTAEGVIPEGWPANGVSVCIDSTNQ